MAHVDAAAVAVRQARENAALSGLENARVRWLVDDAMTFARREIRRGNRYHILMADPPSFGRGGKGGEWKIERDLPDLLTAAGRLLEPERGVLCLTCHSEGWGEDRLTALVRDILPGLATLETARLMLRARPGGHSLAAGFALFGMAGGL